jgi:hypothetical protein
VLVTADLENQNHEDTLHKVAKDLAPKGISEQQIAARMEEFYGFALVQIRTGN